MLSLTALTRLRRQMVLHGRMMRWRPRRGRYNIALRQIAPQRARARAQEGAMRVVYGGLLSIALIANASAQTGISKIECAAAGVTTIVEINYGTRLVRTWTKLDTVINGPVGPSSANITRQKISWAVVRTIGSARNRTTYALDRKKKTLSVVSDGGPRENRGQHLNTPCVPSS